MTWTLFIMLLLSVFHGISCSDLKFKVAKSCQATLSSGLCAKDKRSSRSKLECAVKCSKSDVCLGLRWTHTKECHHYKECNVGDICETEVENSTPKFLAKVSDAPPSPCQNCGTWNEGTNDCSCCGGWVGTWCERRPTGCNELGTYNYAQGDYHIFVQLPGHTDLIRIRCSLKGGYSNTYIFRSNGTTNKSLGWADYVQGFYHDDMNHWFGLENIHKYAASGHNVMHFDVLYYYGGYSANIMRYEYFDVGDASTKYQVFAGSLEVQSHGPFNSDCGATLADCFAHINGTRFSTIDQDNDMDTGCFRAEETQTGWWFKDCMPGCNPLGWSYLKTGETTFQKNHVQLPPIDFVEKHRLEFFFLEMYFPEYY